jgi:glycosyltransferase involved in cell wall biosynthesis
MLRPPKSQTFVRPFSAVVRMTSGATNSRAANRRPGISVVVPVLNGMRFLPITLPTVLAAGRRVGGIELIYVDNGSTDGSREYLQSWESKGLKTHLIEGGTIAGMRNWGARQSSGTYLSFIDSDCSVAENYFHEAIDVLRSTGAAATGCGVHVPEQPHWLEAAWHDLHYFGRDRFVPYLNSGNFFVSRAAFQAVGGFREDMVTGEDAEIGQRLVLAGHRIFASPRVKAIHLGNPKSIREFYRRNVWHGLGMFGTLSRKNLDRPTAMLAIHLVATILGIVGLFFAQVPIGARLLIAIGLQLLAPSATVIYRGNKTQQWRSAPIGVPLYWLYYWARAYALAIVALGLSERYRK